MSTSNAFNAIWIGYRFGQDFEVAEDDFPIDAILWLDLRRAVAPKDVVVSAIELTRVSPTRYRMELTAEQTAPLAAGMLEGDLVQRLEGIDVPLGLRLKIPVLEAATEARP